MPAPAPTKRPRPLVLAVDDQPANLAVASAMLEDLEVDVLTAANGPSALSIAAETQPDLILLDIMMPGMDGHAVFEQLRASPGTRDIPVIFVSALDSPDDQFAGLHEGAVDYITKPIKANLFRVRVQNQLALKFARDRLAAQNAELEREVENRVRENSRLSTSLQMALTAAGQGTWEYRPDNGCIHWDQEFLKILGLPQVPENFDDSLRLVHPEDQQILQQLFAQALPDAGRAAVCEFRMQHADGRWIWLEGRGKIVPDDHDGKRILGTITDISLRKQAEIEERLSSAVFTGISDGVCITDPQGRVLMVNEAFVRSTGYPTSEIVGREMDCLRSGLHADEFYRDIWQTLARHGNWQGEITNRRKDGELISEWLNISAVRDSLGRLTHYVGIYSDLSERKAALERIQYLSSHDHLTGLPNRNLLADRLSQALINAHRFERQTAVILLDINRFRSINETLGPPVGDRLLGEVASRLQGQIRDGDTMGRRGGNEFGFIMANLSHERDAIALVQHLLDALAEPFEIEGQAVVLTASIGVSLAPRDGNDAATLLRTADTALARAKQAGRNTFRFYSPEMDADAARRMALEAALQHAVDRGELSLAYQPQVSLDSGRLIGMEALLRWQHPEFGQISPAEFIPLAEDNGQIVALGKWVLASACRQTKRWLDLGLITNLRVAVNLSTRQFRQADLPDTVSRILEETGLPPAALELEITENAFIEDLDTAIATCRTLKKLGIKLSLDDFGTGYSSLSYVSRFPFDKIKIDQSFVRDIIENPVNAAIATSAIVMARSLNLAVLAEGVETEAQANFLRGRRCDAIQGFLFSRPLAPEAFEQLLAGRPTLKLVETVQQQTPTLLLVDDEPNVLNALSRLLRREGYRIFTATTPSAAFEQLAQHAVQVIISDQRMPEMSGTEFLSRVRQLYPDTIRIVLTGYTDLDSVTNAINHGAIYKFLTKPWDDDLLREQIREAFRLIKAQLIDRRDDGEKP
ncbi:EAL domain-containing protein [Azonexus sp. R2A61]|uniref:EAL domain-containing protein n=1 Tax=Azonexus sp. R2A61 TaxID=2744443 RepID=UPI001F255F3A|nr:EAL domain-containing protein [Azonexus sp. R2A61]